MYVCKKYSACWSLDTYVDIKVLDFYASKSLILTENFVLFLRYVLETCALFLYLHNVHNIPSIFTYTYLTYNVKYFNALNCFHSFFAQFDSLSAALVDFVKLVCYVFSNILLYEPSTRSQALRRRKKIIIFLRNQSGRGLMTGCKDKNRRKSKAKKTWLNLTLCPSLTKVGTAAAQPVQLTTLIQFNGLL
jgi:hypothetical protein